MLEAQTRLRETELAAAEEMPARVELRAGPRIGQRGTAHIDAAAESWAARAWRHALGVFFKESGF